MWSQVHDEEASKRSSPRRGQVKCLIKRIVFSYLGVNNLLTCTQQSSSKTFAKILKYLQFEAGDVLDLTYGKGESWRLVTQFDVPLYFDTKNGVTIKITKVDKYPVEKDITENDICGYLEKTQPNSYDLLYIDPPFFFKEYISDMKKNQTTMLTEDKYIIWSRIDFNNSLKSVIKYGPDILRDDGIVIWKTSDCYVGKKYYPLIFDVQKELYKVFEPYATIISSYNRRPALGSLIHTNHLAYIIVKKIKNNVQQEEVK